MGANDRETLAAEVLHEIRQPLMGLKAWLQLWQEDPSRPTNPATLLAQVERIEQILSDYQRLSSQQPAPKEQVSLEAPVRAAIEAFRRQSRSQGFIVEVELMDGLMLTANARLIEQLVANLVSNARDAVGPGGGKARVVGLRRDGAVVLRVADWGPGLTPEIKANLFRAWNTGKVEGHGLGLLVCRRIADEHGATIDVIDPDTANIVPRPSTVFEVTFGAQKKDETRADAGKPRILVVDDEAVIRVLFRDLLSRDYRVVEASTAEEALAALGSQSFDLVIADKNLPGLSGLELAEKARKTNAAQKIILMTGYPSLTTAQQAAELGLLDYLPKPFDDIRVVRARVRDALFAPPPALIKASNHRVDIYEDNPRVAEQIAAAIRKLKLEPNVVREAGPGGAEPPTALVLSWDLASARGAEGLGMVKRVAPGVPFVVLAEHLTTDAAIDSLRAGASACLPKLLSDADALARELARAFKITFYG
jgi:DNA-binding response OmpR family regulator